MMSKLLRVVVLSVVTLLTTAKLHCQSPSDLRRPTLDQRVENWFSRLDKDDDGKISQEEAPKGMLRSFNRIDSSKDGFIDLEELKRSRNRSNRQRQQNNRQGLSTERLLARAPAGVIVEPDIAYRKGDSKSWRLDLVRPKQKGATPRPAIVFVHGGGWRNGDKRSGYFIRGAMEYAQKGYVCISVNYRLTPEAPFPACIEDVKCAVRWLRANAKKYNIDPQRIGGYGNSAGAHLVAMLGLSGPDAELEGDGPYRDQSSMLQAVCCSATPTNMLHFERLLGVRAQPNPGSRESIKVLARRASPMTYVSEKAPPFLVIHGTADKVVDIKHGDTFVEALKNARVETVEYIRINGAAHSVFNEHKERTYAAMEKFFFTYLREKTASSQ